VSPGPIPPGPLVPAAWFFGAFALAFVVAVLLLTGCSSSQLPPDKCTPLHQRAYLAACERAVLLECSREGSLCPDLAVCHEVLAEVCP
jgi:hypothetical protein